MRLRHTRFFSLAELNQEIRRLLEDLNNRPFKQQPGCRRTLYEQLDQPALRPLPRQAFEYIEFKYARVNIDYHVQYGNHCYSVPHQLVREQVEIRAGQQLVQIFYKGKPVASHPPQMGNRLHHLHRAYARAPPETAAVDTGATPELGEKTGL